MTVFHTSMHWCFLFKNQTSVGCGFWGAKPQLWFLAEIGSLGQSPVKCHAPRAGRSAGAGAGGAGRWHPRWWGCESAVQSRLTCAVMKWTETEYLLRSATLSGGFSVRVILYLPWSACPLELWTKGSSCPPPVKSCCWDSLVNLFQTGVTVKLFLSFKVCRLLFAFSCCFIEWSRVTVCA